MKLKHKMQIKKFVNKKHARNKKKQVAKPSIFSKF